MSNNKIDLDFSKNIFNDSGNGDIEFDVSDYDHNFEVELNVLTRVVLVQVLEGYLDRFTINATGKIEFKDVVHLNKKPRKEIAYVNRKK